MPEKPKPMLGKLFPKVLSLVLLACLAFSLAGCDLKLPPMPWDPPPTEKPADEEAAASEGEGGVEIEPVDLTKLLPEAMRNLPAVEVTIPMRDKLQLYGLLYDPALSKDEEGSTVGPADSDTEYTGPKYPLVILLHGLGRDYRAWGDLPAKLVKAGYAVFVPDLRGHGKSSKMPRGRRVSWRLMESKDWLLLPEDVTNVIRYFQKAEPDYPEVEGKQVALVGERLGANVAAITGHKNDKSVQVLVLMSPGINIKGLEIVRGVMGYMNPVLVLAGQDDLEAEADAQHIYNWLEGLKTLSIYKTGQGADILTGTSAAADQMINWLTEKMPPPGAQKMAGDSSASLEPVAAETAIPADASKPHP